MSVKLTKPKYEASYQDLIALLRKHSALSPIELLAVAANMVGKMMAMQDQRKHTKEQVVEVVAKNIEMGNAQVIEELRKLRGPQH